MVSDITRMGEWSPETTSGRWIKGATGPALGARFKGDNRNGKKTWTIECEVTECTPGRVFAFDAMVGPIRYSNWRYEFDEVNGTTTVSEIWLDKRNKLIEILGRPTSGVKDRTSHNERTMAETLGALERVATS